MRKLVVLGAGTAGTIVVNKLRRRLGDDEWAITIIDEEPDHLYQPGFLFIPFGTYQPDEVVKPKKSFIPKGVDFIEASVDLVEPDKNVVRLEDGTEIEYDYLVIATGTHPRPDQTPGLEGEEYGKTIHDFFSLEGATALADALEDFDGGRLVVNLIELPIKCPVAPLEFAFLAESYFRKRGMRDRVELTFVTPLDGAFTKPVAARQLGGMLDERKIALETDFYLERVDAEARNLVSYDEREVPYDLLVTVPINMGADFVARSGLGDELNHVYVDQHTFLAKDSDNIFALGDAANLPTSKAGSSAHFSADVFTDNFLRHIEGKEMLEQFDGHANCFVESGDGKAMLIDFNYDTQPLPGKYPVPGIGPFSLLKETGVNHWGKMGFKWAYWNVLLPGRRTPLPAHMSMAGKRQVDTDPPQGSFTDSGEDNQLTQGGD
jgi:sulfide:quinone oxidoreductase